VEDGKTTPESMYLNNETLVEWQRLHSKQDLTSNNAVAVFLIEHKFLA